MNARQKRLLRKEQAKKRKQLVYEQDLIETTRCKGCTDRKREYTDDRHNYKTTVTQECGHCPYFKRLNEIGGELLNLSKHQKTLEERESTIMATNIKTQTPIAVKYERSDLTPERYREHKSVDKLTDDKIREMYGDFPKSSFDKWKKDNDLVKPYKKDEAPVAKSEQSDAQLQREHEKLKIDHDSLKIRYEETAERCRQLEQELVIERETNATKSDLLNSLEKKLTLEQETSATKSELLLSFEADIKKLEQELQAHKDKDTCSSNVEADKVEASNECATCKELATLLQQRDEQDEELTDAINK